MSNISNPARRLQSVTPNDTTELSIQVSGLFVGGAGNVAVTTTGGDTVTLTGVPAGAILPIQAKIVLSTGTTATNIVALGQ